MAGRKAFFKDFSDFWSVAQYYTNKQRRAVMRALPQSQRKAIEASYRAGGWLDIVWRNKADAVLDAVRDEYGQDLLRIGSLVRRGKIVRVDREFWDEVCDRFRDLPERHTAYIFGGFRASRDEEDSDEYLLVPTEGR